MPPLERSYGDGDASFLAAGGQEGIQRLVEDFYAEMRRRPEAARILRLHPKDLSISIDKLARFLCGWMGGPNRFREKYGPIVIPLAHRHLPIGPAERDAWLGCMEAAIAAQPCAEDFKVYLLAQLRIPAERVMEVARDPGQSGEGNTSAKARP
jgi:hemoglobin